MIRSLRRFAFACAALAAPAWGCEGSGGAVAPPPVVAVVAPAPLPVGPVKPPAFAPPQWQRAPGPPLTLTASDGSGLTLTRLTARAVVAEPLAFTELHLAFDNPRDRAIEGTFSITLPPRASIARFAMRTNDGWQEGEVVELQAARRAYEDFLHRRQDPALLEQGAGNQFNARVFPIPARGQKELVVSYAEELASGAPYALALKGLPEVAELDVQVAGDGVAEQAYRETRTTPSGDLVFDRRAAAPGEALRNGKRVVARVKPLGSEASAAADPVNGLLVLVDTSGSRALGFREQTRLVQRIVALEALKSPSTPLRVACFDQDVESIFDGPASGFGDREAYAIQARAALGASNLEQALAWAREHAGGASGVHRVLVVTDGVPTAGATDGEHLHAATATLRGVGVERLDVVAVGGIRDEAALHGLVTGALARDGVVVDAGLGAERIVQKLGAATRSGIAVRVEGATFSYPERLDGMQPGDEALVYAEVGDAPALRISVDGAAPAPVRVGPVDAPLLERALAQAHIARLLDREAAEGRSLPLQEEIVELAVRHRIVTPYTGLLVLETDADFARYDIARRGLADILTVQGGRLLASSRASVAPPRAPIVATETTPVDGRPANKERVTVAPEPPSAEDIATGAVSSTPGGPSAASATFQAPPAPPPPPPPSPSPQPVVEAAPRGAAPLDMAKIGEGGGGSGEGIGLGNIGTLGHGAGAGIGQGFGSGHGRLGGAHTIQAPRIRQGSVQVNGRLPPEVIERIVRQNFGRFRLCYENGLRSNPNLQGRVAVRFVIDHTGAVDRTQDGGSDLPDAGVLACVLRGFGNLSFPAPESGAVTVVYPILFSPGEASHEQAAPPAPEPPAKPAPAEPYAGKLRDVMELLARKDVKGARGMAQAWHDDDPGDILGLVALGETLEASHEDNRAARAYGSLIDLFPARADMRRFAGSRLERVKGGGAEALALDSYAKAEGERPDHPSSHRLLAYALLKSGAPARAFEAAVAGLKHPYPESRFPGVHQILQEDVGLIGAAWAKAEPARRPEILGRIKEAGGTAETSPSIRFVLTWETDANDVDFHIYDSAGGHAFYQQKHLRSGGDLYADVTTGYGPECFTIRGPKERRAALYTLQANYYSRGPMGYGMGKLEVIDHDGKGGLTFEEHPYVVMLDHAFVDLGVIKR
jgi:hypothetical protein